MKKEVDFSEDKLGDYLSFPYPEELFDEDGYPTDDALDYINNWSMIADENDNAVRFGQFFPNQNYTNRKPAHGIHEAPRPHFPVRLVSDIRICS